MGCARQVFTYRLLIWKQQMEFMSHKISPLVYALICFGMFVLASACVEEQPQAPPSQEPQAEERQVDVDIAAPSSFGELSAVTANTCPTTISEPCEPGCFNCNLRCCDGTIVRLFNVACGSCGALAQSNSGCGLHGGPNHIRWCEPN